MLDYIVKPNISFSCGFPLDVDIVIEAIHRSNDSLYSLPNTLFRSIDYKTTSAMIGCIFCEQVASLTNGNAIVNPIEKGHPDIVPSYAANATEAQLRNYPTGLEVKCTIGNLRAGYTIGKAEQRIDALGGITWQAHHQEVHELLGLTFDYFMTDRGSKPAITAAFYSDNLCQEDWGDISGTKGRNTKVCGMCASGKQKMGAGWFAIVRYQKYIERYKQIFKIRDL